MKVEFLFSLFLWCLLLHSVFGFLSIGRSYSSLSPRLISSFYQNHRLYIRYPIKRYEINRVRNRRRWFPLETLKKVFDFDKYKDALKLTEEEQIELQNHGKSIISSEDVVPSSEFPINEHAESVPSSENNEN
jgi:hypothetical protein